MVTWSQIPGIRTWISLRVLFCLLTEDFLASLAFISFISSLPASDLYKMWIWSWLSLSYLRKFLIPKTHWMNPTAPWLSHFWWFAANVLSAWGVPHPKAKSSVIFRPLTETSMIPPAGTQLRCASHIYRSCLFAWQCWVLASQKI